jgi:hypothetical protein
VTKRHRQRVGASRPDVKGAKQHGADDRNADSAANTLRGADYAAGRASVSRIDSGDDEVDVRCDEKAAADTRGQ